LDWRDQQVNVHTNADLLSFREYWILMPYFKRKTGKISPPQTEPRNGYFFPRKNGYGTVMLMHFRYPSFKITSKANPHLPFQTEGDFDIV